ncbi:HDOD domain-containing protein [Spartinivicinus poritis]|uniref:HDOD domain-containing protein n=1 Tax=Spartinivicinus poritis TaxID=2994640 RepID=A0ABT5U3W9_9GAMM|nr:HDOD domain-containing protein [Spartinivicinus sp. A2-2]MDE1461012.1 HDOD domain-containing protein [Spartinivicinus sp. A2-2]
MLEDYAIYRTVIEQVLREEEQLPSLPTITMKIRAALTQPNTTNSQLAQLIKADPSLTALLLKYACSPLYRTRVSPKSLTEVIAHLGWETVDRIVMSHSIKSLFTMQSPQLKKLFHIAWERQKLKSAISYTIAKHLSYKPLEEVLIASLISDLGTLAVLSAFKSKKDVPSEKTYYTLCREYSKSLGIVLLKKWGVNEHYIETIRYSGKWQGDTGDNVTLIDLINLGLFSAIRILSPQVELPAINSLTAFRKLPEELAVVTSSNELQLINQYKQEISLIVQSF